MSTPPNVLFLMADQLAPFYLPSYGHPLVQTPHIQGVAARGMVFDAAYCNYPICASSRFSMLSGRLSSRIGAYDNGAEFLSSTPTFVHYLRALGYHTCLGGKMHFVGADQLHGFEERITTDIYPSDFGWTADWSAGTPQQPESPTGINMRSVVEAGICKRSMQLDYDEDVAAQAVQKIYDLARAPEQRPFLLAASFTHPHNPFVITRDYWDLYRHEDIDLPRTGPIPWAEMDDHSRRLHHMFKLDEHDITAERTRTARHAYYGMVSYVDAKMGAVLTALEESGLADNTVVIITADHGEMLGERGFWFKSSFFEGSIRVPLIVAVPGGRAGRSPAVVSLLDLFPTILDLATNGAPPPLVDPVDGHSLRPLLDGRAEGWPDRALAEYTAEGSIAPCVMIRQGRHKYIHCEADRPQLYDLAADPFERENLAGRADSADAEASLRAAVLAEWDLQRYRDEVQASQQRRLFLQRVLMSGQTSPWDFQPHRDARKQYVRGGAKTTLVKGRARFPYVDPVPPDTPRAGQSEAPSVLDSGTARSGPRPGRGEGAERQRGG